LSRIKLDGTSLGAACASEYGDGGGGGTACGGATARYRSADGSCNNLKRPRWGRANTAYKRLLFPAYKDGKKTRARVHVRRIRQRSACTQV